MVFINSTANSSGSYWTNFSGWTEFDKANALALLMAAKTNEHRMNVYTEAPGGCSIQQGRQTVKNLYMANNK